MTPIELQIKIKNKTELDIKLWERDNICRIYFNLKSKVDSFLELEVEDNNVISATSKYYYTGKPTSPKWIYNYTKEVREYMDIISTYATRCISRQKKK